MLWYLNLSSHIFFRISDLLVKEGVFHSGTEFLHSLEALTGGGAAATVSGWAAGEKDRGGRGSGTRGWVGPSSYSGLSGPTMADKCTSLQRRQINVLLLQT